MLGGLAQHLGEVLAVGVHGPRHERRLGAEGERHRVERVVDRAERGRLGDGADVRRRGVLALGQPVDLVVEQQDLEVDVAPQRVDQVVAADGQGVAVTGDDPHREVLAARGQAGGDRRGAAVDRVHPVGVEVVREARRAADARDEDDVLALEAELGQEALHGGEDRVVAAPGAPADLLVGGEVLAWSAGRVLREVRHAVRAPARRGARHTEVCGAHRFTSCSGDDGVGELDGGERQAAHLRERLDVDEVPAAQQQRELAHVHLGDEHGAVAPQHVAGVGGERVEVAQVGPRDLGPGVAHAADARRRWARRSSPSRGRAPRPRRSGRRPRGRRSWRRCPSTLPARSRVIRSWLSGS